MKSRNHKATLIRNLTIQISVPARLSKVVGLCGQDSQF